MKISVVSPVYGCRSCLEKLVEGIESSMAALACTEYEIILIDDASPDGSWEHIVGLRDIYTKIIGVKLSRNFGQHAAIHAGLAKARGEWVVVMDCDLQDLPSEIPELYRKAQEGFDVVLARRVRRQDTFIKRWFSKAFYSLLGYLTNTRIDPSVGNFGVYHRRVINAVLSMGDYVRFFPSAVSWVGFRRAYLPITHGQRSKGKSSYNYRSLMRLGLSVVLGFSDKPLRIVVKFGFLITFAVLTAAVVMFVRYLRGDIAVLGYTSLILSIWFFGGLLISILGLTGLYVGRTFDQAKNRPVFIVAENSDDGD